MAMLHVEEVDVANHQPHRHSNFHILHPEASEENHVTHRLLVLACLILWRMVIFLLQIKQDRLGSNQRARSMCYALP